ncbi:ABC transporter ATP-binding protein [Kordiimonas sp. SCSIO 12610]|uniref:ABC transporter ATP-binding protein n=1 Tax=Kordiimonas sp. SCSIO 12610 TaxID=2829597 RepID=UPI00210EEE51|nr:ABC transporter ATP-binding protein [Kordiimonas sp. SCSIO 12610]UTW54673.1 ABC transporter ATP-binding protein [Kordiimonas sp. SCSIO 12610]
MEQYCLETQGLTKQFGKKTALKDFNLKIPQGGIHAIVGSNGAGKSTLFRLLLGVETPTYGSASLLGENSLSLSSDVRGRVGYVNEEHTLPTWMRAKDVVRMQKSFYPNWNQSIYDEVIAYFDVEADQKVSGLSRGERAGLNLSIALAQRPEILILDEPTLGLDVVARQSFLEALMFTETEDNTTIIYCSHQMEEIERVAERLIIMENGELKNNSSPDEFVERVTCWVIGQNLVAAEIEALPGYLTHKKIGEQIHIMAADQDDSFGTQLEKISGGSVNQLPINLEKAVNAFLAANHKKPDSK